MEIRVFDINDDVREEQLDAIDTENIEKVFKKIFSSENSDHLKIACHANDDSILREYHTDIQNFNIPKLAEGLRSAELKTDGTRNKQITEGSLFVKKENSRLILLKLESIEVVDKENHYEMMTKFSTEANYYKGCILERNLDNITIIDRNRSVAKYWREDFLKLSLNRDDYQNSNDLIEFLKEDTLFTQDLKEKDNFYEIKSKTEDYIFNEPSFDKVALANNLRDNNLIEEQSLNEIYSEQSIALDSEFLISVKALKDNYKKTIQVSKDTKIHTDNYAKLVKRQGIDFEDGKIILSVSDEYLNELPEELKHDD